MTHLCCPLHVDAPEQVGEAIEKARLAAEKGASLIEWRCDLLGEEEHTVALVAIRSLIAESPLPSIVTIRPTWEGGLYGGSETDRVSLIEAIGTDASAPAYLDLELDAYRTSRNRRQKINLAVDHEDQVRSVTPRLILSSHDFRERPSDLMQRVAAMAAEPACAVMKIAWQARSLRDNLEAFELLSERAKPMSALCMGEFGLLSRVLAPKFGAHCTFAALERGAESAPGQPTLDELRDLYRFAAITPATRVYGVLGWPVAHSRSPAYHNRRFAEAHFNGVYLPLPVPPEWEHWKATVGSLVDDPRLDFRGASVTLPHKEHCVRLVRERGGRVSGLAAALGAANTLVVGADRSLACANTDAPAVVACLRGAFDGRETLEGLRVAVVGAGGVARAAAGAIALAGGTVVIINRSVEKAEALAEELNASLGAIAADALDPCESFALAQRPGRIVVGRADSLGCGCYHAFVQCTPVGMAGGPAPDRNPLEDLAGAHVPLGEAVVFDTVYAPEWTPLLAEARSAGARCISGLAMFDEQARRQSERWLGA
jgi:3-dehydroquinate dehydratase / shikimate dehydrogenase